RPHTLHRSRLSSTTIAALNRSAVHSKRRRCGAPFHGRQHVTLLHGLLRGALLHECRRGALLYGRRRGALLYGRWRGALLHARCSTTPPLPVSAPRTGSSSRNPLSFSHFHFFPCLAFSSSQGLTILHAAVTPLLLLCLL
ncbi:hypothetical protein S245_061569, partial [Arachis hypogaea]